jgi:malate dehydrogenase
MTKVAVLGAAGGIGQPLALLMKTSPLVTELACYDVAPFVPGVAVDLSHICTPAKTTGHKGDDGLPEALKGAGLVIIPAGVPRKPGMTRDDLFNINAGIIRTLATAIAQNCPTAFVLVITNPVNSTVPVVAEVLKQQGCYDPKRLFGVTTLDVVRAKTFIGGATGVAAADVEVPVIGGHAGKTIIPLFSQAKPAVNFDAETTAALLQRIQFGGDEVVEAKAGAGSATLSMAYAGYRFAQSLLEAAAGKAGVIECAFVENNGALDPSLAYSAIPVELGPQGVGKFHVPALSEQEKGWLASATEELNGSIKKGSDFITAAK